jgi:hypothetical protein
MSCNIFVRDGFVSKLFGVASIETYYLVVCGDICCKLDRMVELKKGHHIIMCRRRAFFGLFAGVSCDLVCVI